MEELLQILKDEEKEITDVKGQILQAKETAIHEYRDSKLLLTELDSSFTEGYDDALRQVKVSYPDLDVSHITIDAQGQTLAQFVQSESTDGLVAVSDLLVNEDPTLAVSQVKLIEGDIRQAENKEKNENAQQQ